MNKKLHELRMIILVFHFLFLSCSCESCLIKNHNFYLIPLIKYNITENLKGLNKYDYNLILETNPLNQSDSYYIIFSIIFPINVNIELNTEIIYKFESANKFCLLDLTKKSEGRQYNIQGRLTEYNSEIQILERIWIKIEKVLLIKEVSFEIHNTYLLLTEFKENDENKKYILIKKMTKTTNKQFFQIVRVNINKKYPNIENIDCLNNENNLPVGTEFAIKEINKGDDSMLREGINYETFIGEEDTEDSNYSFNNVENLVCLFYEKQFFGNKCFSSDTNMNKKNFNSIN